MNGFYRPYPQDELHQQNTGSRDNGPQTLGNPEDGGAGGMVGGQSLDDIVTQNTKDMRRRSFPVQFGATPGAMDSDLRRMSMMGFGGGSPLDSFQFNPTTAQDLMMSNQPPSGSPLNQNQGSGSNNLALNTQFSGQGHAFGQLATPASAYASPLTTSTPLDMDMTGSYDQHGISMSMDMSDSPMAQDMMGGDMSPMMFPQQQQQFASPMLQSPMNMDFSTSMPAKSQPIPAKQIEQPQAPVPQVAASEVRQSITPRTNNGDQSAQPESRQPSVSTGTNTTAATPNIQYSNDMTPPVGRTLDVGKQVENGPKLPWDVPAAGYPSTAFNKPHMQTQFTNAYSSTGFDMLGVLMRVATRPNPEINIGSVDLSCSFVVCDAELDDVPIVYCSENFERLTGYTKHMILGRNCRFLQSPDGKVEPRVKRKYVDDDSVLYLKNMIASRREAQISLINYRRGGQPFMNLLTMIPIAWEPGGSTKFFVGFQVDLVEQPNSVTSKNPDGSYTINYQRGMSLPSYAINTPENRISRDPGQTVNRDDVSTVLSTIGTGESDLSKRIFDKILLENTDDVVHVLSLKGLFLYLSPSCRKILEYDSSELTGTALSSVCHPSDIVPVTRELKEASNGVSVNVVYRIRRKQSGYMWFESHGSLHTEQGKGRKCIILVGRERPVYTVAKNDIVDSGGIGDSELWSKISTSGMFLFVSSNVRSLLDRHPDELVGTSMQTLMRQDGKNEFGRILEHCRTGRRTSAKHDMMNKRGQTLQVFTTLYPGDAQEGSKPTFIVAQTRFVKFNKGSATALRPSLLKQQQQNSSGSNHSISSMLKEGSTAGDMTPMSKASSNPYNVTDGIAATYAGQNGLTIGRQDESLASEENIFDELKTTRSSSWQYELRQMEKRNRLLAEEMQTLVAAKKKRKRRKGADQQQRDCANCHTMTTPEWRRGPSGARDLCNSCGLRWAKQNGRVSPRTSSQQSVHSDKASRASASPKHNLATEVSASSTPKASTKGGPGAQEAQSISHAAKVARMEAIPIPGFSGGVPPKIDEVVEPEEPK
ncbi:hypothetical protein K402DRAFT_397929 [Aulographum hederae CBS 113979]|uniref:White collar n=1 Tax=Aulographum hederae CBS 113979 TaxID=1176131 RepID=A0A6G1GMK1_9PEZI|nr:hypothetical protein K402DRAFT_397929 [Aulographum hederae CBS 113979]